MRSALGIAGLSLILAAGPAVAAQQGQAGSDRDLPDFQKADSNDNGQLTFQEVKQLGIKKERFRAEDLDGDGKLSKYDYKYGIK